MIAPTYQCKPTTYSTFFLVMLAFAMKVTKADTLIFQRSRIPTITPSITSAPAITQIVQLSHHPTHEETQTETASMTRRYQTSNKPSPTNNIEMTKNPTQIRRSTNSPKPTIIDKYLQYLSSVQPTNDYTARPTKSQIHHYSLEPSLSEPSSIPTMKPKITESINPSDFPSLQPVIKRTAFPSQNPIKYPSYPPIGTETKFPIKKPSSSPSYIPSFQATILSSRNPIHSISHRPSVRRTRSPSTINSTHKPSIRPTIGQTFIPTRKQFISSSSPVSFPTTNSTIFPVIKPSDLPTKLPIANKTAYPQYSLHPSNLHKSSHPTMARVSTFKPSAIPATTCHDSQTYHTPLTGTSCEHYKSTNCFMSIQKGMTKAQLDYLLARCPISCNVPCNVSWRVSYITIDLYFFNTSGFMSSTDQETFSMLALRFVDTTLNQSTWNTSHIASMIITNQTLLRNTWNHRFLWLHNDETRNLREQVSLHVSLKATFYSSIPIMDEDSLKLKLAVALTDNIFKSTLTKQIDYFVGVDIKNSTFLALPHPNQAANSHKVIWLSTILSFLILSVFGSAFFVVRRRRSKSTSNFRSDSFRETFPPKFIESNVDNQELQSHAYPHYPSMLANDFAFGTSLSIFSTRSRSSSENSTKSCPHVSPHSIEDSHIIHTPIQESILDSKALVPPIIVIDNADDDQSNLGSEVSEPYLKSPPNVSRIQFSSSELNTIQKQGEREMQPSMYDFLL